MQEVTDDMGSSLGVRSEIIGVWDTGNSSQESNAEFEMVRQIYSDSDFSTGVTIAYNFFHEPIAATRSFIKRSVGPTGLLGD